MLDTHPRWRHFEVNWKAQSIAPHLNGHMLRQFTRFIRPGDVIVPTGMPGVLAAVSDERERAVLVIVNDSDAEETHTLRLTGIPDVSAEPYAYRTSAGEANGPVSAARWDAGQLRMVAAPHSTTSLVFAW